MTKSKYINCFAFDCKAMRCRVLNGQELEAAHGCFGPQCAFYKTPEQFQADQADRQKKKKGAKRGG